ncbi:MAG: GtrA family protein [Clostridia bacterium]|nr:GtrA family protein [Clostridia bacterium]
MEKIKLLVTKVCTREVIFYGIFGVLTTIINIVVSHVLESKFHIDGAIASAIGIILSVIFAYFSNRKLVFNSTANSFKEQFNEFKKFILGRAFTMVLEEGGVILFYEVMGLPFLPVKLSLTIIVIILNFFISKLFAFRHA